MHSHGVGGQRDGGRDAGRRAAQGVRAHDAAQPRRRGVGAGRAGGARRGAHARDRRGAGVERAERARLRVGVRGAGGRAPGGRGQ